MSPLSCARAQAVRQAHTRKLEAHINFPSKIVFVHISYTSLQKQTNHVKMLHKRNFMRTQTVLVSIAFPLRLPYLGVFPYCIVLYSSIYIAPLNSHRQTEALLVRLAPRKETSF